MQWRHLTLWKLCLYYMHKWNIYFADIHKYSTWSKSTLSDQELKYVIFNCMSYYTVDLKSCINFSDLQSMPLYLIQPVKNKMLSVLSTTDHSFNTKQSASYTVSVHKKSHTLFYVSWFKHMSCVNYCLIKLSHSSKDH